MLSDSISDAHAILHDAIVLYSGETYTKRQLDTVSAICLLLENMRIDMDAQHPTSPGKRALDY